MNIVEINSVNRGSTGNIMYDIAEVAKRNNHKVLVCYPKSRGNMFKYRDGDYLVGNRFFRNIGRFMSSHFKAEHYIHVCSTIMLILRLKKFHPNVIHIHNIHDSFINIPLFLYYVKHANIPVVWTLHDCWLYTGHCPYYIETGCYKWQSECMNCRYYNQYPGSSYDDSNYKYVLKRRLLIGLGNKLSLVPVSAWLANEVNNSFLKDVHRQVISNGIDMDIFKPREDINVKQKYGIPDGRIFLAAATSWDNRKGLSDYCKLSEKLTDDEYLVLVGIDNMKAKDLPNGIIGIERTDDKEDMAKLYSLADVVLSLSYSETFGMTIIEANACGTPVVVYDNTAQPELISNDNGLVVKTGDVCAVYEAIKKICRENRGIWKIKCREKVYEKYNKDNTYHSYLNLFKSVTNVN